MAQQVDFISFGTNNLTQLVWGISREDYIQIFNKYLWSGLIEYNPFDTIDEDGVIPFLKYAIQEARKANPKIKIGICGTQAFSSMKTLYDLDIDYISINKADIPSAILMIAQCSLNKK